MYSTGFPFVQNKRMELQTIKSRMGDQGLIMRYVPNKSVPDDSSKVLIARGLIVL